MLFLSESERRAEQLAAILHAFDGNSGVMVLPAWDSLPYDGSLPSPEITGRRASVLRRLTNKRVPALVLATAESALQRVAPLDVWKDATLHIRRNMQLSEDDLGAFLRRTGYAIEPKVEMPGEASLHEQVADIFPAGALAPIRLDYADDRIVSISTYDPETQRSTGEINEIVIDAASEIIPAPAGEHAAQSPVRASLSAH
ncbi:MAG: hypothetical protein ACJ8F3_01765 [Xanthobacteraceae bacterium]